MIAERKRVYIVVKTYPTISAKYAELVCTAGVLEDGTWIRLYPIPFRKLDIEQKYKKYSWINIDVVRNTSDFRPETYRPYTLDTLEIETESKQRETPWGQRKEIIFRNKKIYTNFDELINKAKTEGTSLAIFQPTKITGFICKETERDWDKNKLELLKAESQQLNFFQTPQEIEEEFRVVNKVPYKFSYKFEDDSGKERTLMIEDWEIGMLYFNCLKRANNNEKEAIEKVKTKYLTEFGNHDLYFFLGTTKAFHNVAPNPFIIIGVFYPPKDLVSQKPLF